MALEFLAPTFCTKNVHVKYWLNWLQEIAHEINALKNLYNITKIGFALDTSVSDRHNVPAKDDSSLTEAQIIYRTQAVIVALLSEMIYGQKNYIAQYDETSSW